MGIQGFSDVFPATDTVKKDFKQFAGKTIAIDASMEIHRALRGTKSINQLTAADGSHTQHISVLLANILERMSYGITDIWVFDNPADNAYKKEEIDARRTQRAKSSASMISSIDDLEQYIKHEKSATPMVSDDVNDIKYMLDLLGVRWTEAPPNVEAEKVCAALPVDMVLSSDSDALVYGAKVLLKRCLTAGSKVFQLYYLDEMLARTQLSRGDLIKIAVLLGTDHNRGGRKGIGAKTVLKKFRQVELTEAEQEVYHIFADPVDIGQLEWHQSPPDHDRLIAWLEQEKSFSRDRLDKLFAKRIKRKA